MKHSEITYRQPTSEEQEQIRSQADHIPQGQEPRSADEPDVTGQQSLIVQCWNCKEENLLSTPAEFFFCQSCQIENIKYYRTES